MNLATVDIHELVADRDHYLAKVARHRGRGSVIESAHLETLRAITNELGRREWTARAADNTKGV